MKVLQINTRYIGGGGAAYIANILHENINKKKDVESIFLYGRGRSGDSKSFKIILPYMEYLSAMSYRIIGKEINLNIHLEKFISECDIVHLHNIHGYYIDIKKLFLLLKKHNKPIVWTLHDMWPLTGRCAYSFKCDKWKFECGKCEYKDSYPRCFLDISKENLKIKKDIIKNIDSDRLKIITPSKWLADMCKESYLNRFEIINIANGIYDTDINESKVSLRNKYNLPTNKKIILFVAADLNDERKGIKYILDIINECKEYNFISIGKEIEGYNLENFEQLGYIKDRTKINEIYSLADLFVIPSLEDNFPTTILEAFSNSTPVVGFNIGGIPEQVEDNLGMIVENISSKELKIKIKKMLEDDKQLQKFSENCRKTFDEKYNVKKFVEDYIKIYYKFEEKL